MLKTAKLIISRNWERFLPVLILLGGAYLLFANTFGNAWTLDDLEVIVQNPDIRSLKDFFKNSNPGRPLREVTYIFDYALFGLDPAGYHIQQIFWHGLNAFLVFLLILQLEGGKAVAWITSLLFLVHPVQVEVAAGIANRKDSLALAFSLLSFLSFAESFRPRRRRIGWLILSLLLWLVALFGKQTAVALPLVYMGYELAFVSPPNRWLLKYNKLVLVLLGGVVTFSGVWFFFLGGRSLHLEGIKPLLLKMNVFTDWREGLYFLMVLKSWAFMFSKIVFPVSLAPEYVYPAPASWWDPLVVAAIVGLVLYVFFLWHSLKRRPLVFFALTWMGTFWLPVSNLWPIAYFAADRYLYAPSVGVFILVAMLISQSDFKFPRTFKVVAPALIFISALLTWQQNRVWSSVFTLWNHAVEVSPESSLALNNLGSFYAEEGDLRRAFNFFHKAAEVNPYNPTAQFNLGWIYERFGDQEKAFDSYQRFLALNDPKYREQAQDLRMHLLGNYGVNLD